MRKIYLLLFIFSFVLGFTQTVNLYNPVTNVNYPAQQYFCTGETFNLKVDAVATSTGDYAITKDLPSNYPLSAGSIPINFPALGTNKFSDTFPIGFTFSFYGKNYTKAVMGSNGRLVFTNDPALNTLNDINVYTDRTYSGVTGYNTYSVLPSTDYNKVFRNNPTQELNLAQIFFGYTDLVPRSQNSSVTYLYKNITFGGLQGLLVSIQNQIRTNGSGGISSTTYNSNIILLEDGRIINYVNNKTDDSYNAILGIQNEDASKFKFPVHSNVAYNYNNGKWKSEGVAWVFTPNQSLTPQFKWYRNGTQIPGQTADTLSNFVPDNSDVLKVEVTYHDPSGTQVGPMVSDQITFSKVNTPVIEATLDCSYEMKVSNATYDPALRYTWYKVGDPAPLRIGQTLSIHRNTQTPGNYYVKVTKPDGSPICSAGDESNRLTYNNQRFPGLKNTSFTVCDNTGTSTSKTLNLYDIFYPKYDPASGLEPYIVRFSTSTGGGTGAVVPDPANFVLPANTDVHLQFAVFEGSGINACHTGGLSISFLSMPVAETIALCASATVFNLKAYFQKPSYPFYSYLYTYADGSSAGDGSNVDTNKQVLVKTTIPGGCSVTTTVSFSKGTATVLPTVPMQERCAGTDNNANRFDFNAITAVLDPTNQFDIKFYNKSDNSEIVPGAPANANLNTAGYFWTATTGDYIVYAKAFNKADPTCFAVSNDIVLRVNLRPSKSSTADAFLRKTACGVTTVDLTVNSVFDVVNTIAHSQVPTLKYFDAGGVELTGTDISNYPLSRGMPYLEIQNGPCLPALRLGYNIVSQPFPLMNPAAETLCDDTDGNPDGNVSVNIGADSFKQKFTSDISNATFKYYNGTQLIHTSTGTGDAFSYSISDNKTIRVTVSSAAFCPADAEITYFVNAPDPIQFSGNTDVCFGDNLTFSIVNFNDFSSVKLIAPDGTETPVMASHTVSYADLSFGKPYQINAVNASGCNSQFAFTPSNSNQPKIDVINQTNTSLEVLASGGVKPYKYYFNGIAQNSNVLMNPTEASYEIQVESATGCLGEPKTIYFIRINNAFTPNSDGLNDVWTIENLDRMENVSLVVVDRYGNKVFESQGKNKIAWDGRSNGRTLATSTYWYTVTWYDALTRKNEKRQGWILLKNRD